ncbi:hypothetical protein ACWKSP_04820 [Micromonosporaceae bacterium Da 78-11]
MPHRRLTALALAVVASTTLAGCEIDLQPGSVQAPFSIAPTPSASHGVPKYVCSAVYKILTDGAVQLAGYLQGTSDEAKQGMRDTFTDMSAKVTAAGAETTDADLKQATARIATSLTAASAQVNPKAYVDGDFATVGQNLDEACK